MAWLLDTNAWIYYLKSSEAPVRKRLEQVPPDEVVTCSIVRAELLLGAKKYGDPERRRAVVLKTLAPYHSAQFDDAAAESYAAIRDELEIQGNVIGPHDLLIAAICVVHGFTLVTSNVREFSRVKGLKIEDWNRE